MSPASGDTKKLLINKSMMDWLVSIQLMSPASGDAPYLRDKGMEIEMFPFN